MNQRDASHELGCCFSKHAPKILDALKNEAKKQGISAEIRVNKSGCLSQCELGPIVVVYPEATWYVGVKEEDAAEIISALKNTTKVERLLHPKMH